MNIEFEAGESAQGGCGTVGIRILASLFFLIFLSMGLGFSFMMASDLVRNVKVCQWENADCTIIESRVENRVETSSDSNPYSPVIRFKYTFNGRDYVSDQLQLHDQSTDDYTEAQGRILQYPKGVSATCLVNPENPSEAILERGSFWGFLAIFFPMIFVAVGATGLFFTWRHTGKSRPSAPSISQRVSSVDSQKLTLVMGIVFLLIGSIVFFFLFVSPMFELFQARQWAEVPCTVVHATVTTHSGDDGDTYSIDILYEFRFGDTILRSDRYDFSDWSSSGYASKRRIIDAYPRGSRALCFVDPDNPHRAVLNRDFQAAYLIGLLPLIFFFVGLGLLIHSLKQKSGSHDSSLRSIGHNNEFEIPDTQPRGPLVLKPTLSPFAKLAGVTAICLFWNGIISIFVWPLFSEWSTSGDISWFLTLFLIPFVLIGIVLFGGIVYFLLALANPRPTLTLSNSTIRLGDSIGIEWRFKGQSSRITTLTITLEGLESATYRQGTDTHTDTEVFHRAIVVHSVLNYEIERGQRQFVIPGDTMHSWNSDNNSIIWKLKIKGDIPKWPDVNENFDIRVLPFDLESLKR